MQQFRCYVLLIGSVGIKEDLLRLISQQNACIPAVLLKHILISALAKRVKRADKNNVTGLELIVILSRL